MGGGITNTSITSSSFFNYASGRTRNVTNAGQFFFDSPDRLLLRDTNGVTDVYEYSSQDHRVHLISTGQSPDPSYFGDATPSGSDAFFVTRQAGLVGQDTDPFYDLYDARTEGGIAAQSPAVAEECEGDGCQGPFTSEPAGQPGPGTSVFSGPGNPPGKKPCPKGKVRRNGRCAKKHRSKHHGKHKHHRHHPAGHARRTR